MYANVSGLLLPQPISATVTEVDDKDALECNGKSIIIKYVLSQTSLYLMDVNIQYQLMMSLVAYVQVISEVRNVNSQLIK